MNGIHVLVSDRGACVPGWVLRYHSRLDAIHPNCERPRVGGAPLRSTQLTLGAAFFAGLVPLGLAPGVLACVTTRMLIWWVAPCWIVAGEGGLHTLGVVGLLLLLLGCAIAAAPWCVRAKCGERRVRKRQERERESVPGVVWRVAPYCLRHTAAHGLVLLRSPCTRRAAPWRLRNGSQKR